MTKDDYDVREYQDDLDTDPSMSDSATHDETDDPVEGFGVPAEEFKRELDRIDGETTEGEYPEDTEDMREEIQDLYEGQGKRD